MHIHMDALIIPRRASHFRYHLRCLLLCLTGAIALARVHHYDFVVSNDSKDPTRGYILQLAGFADRSMVVISFVRIYIYAANGDELHQALRHQEHPDRERAVPWTRDSCSQGGHRVCERCQPRLQRCHPSLVRILIDLGFPPPPPPCGHSPDKSMLWLYIFRFYVLTGMG